MKKYIKKHKKFLTFGLLNGIFINICTVPYSWQFWILLVYTSIMISGGYVFITNEEL